MTSNLSSTYRILRTCIAATIFCSVWNNCTVRGHADEKECEALLKTLLECKVKSAKALNAVKDKQSALDGLQKLNELSATWHQTDEKLQKTNDLSEDARKRLVKTYAERLESAENDLDTEYDRLDRVADLYAVLAQNPIVEKMYKYRVELAENRVFILTGAVKTYFDEFKKFPAKLEELAKLPGDNNPFAEKDAFVDPWGRPYQYDAKGPKNKGLFPDVWSLGPRHREGAIFGNWSKKQ
jgi:hypothetical protein